VGFELPLTRMDMADYLGLTIETISRQMTCLKECGVIGVQGGRGIVIRDVDRLNRIAEMEPSRAA
jgi:CRP/FNR family transcriptional regulator